MRRNSDNEDDCTLVMALISNFSVLSFCRVGDDKWTNVEHCLNHLQDVIRYNGQIYAVDYEGITVIYDFTGDKKMRQIANAPKARGDEHRYLVESTQGDLLQVVRLFDYGREGICRSNDFKVYKLEAVDEPVEPVEGRPYYRILNKRVIIRDKFKFKWVEMESLGDQAMFKEELDCM
ncbi:uncharacterized protein A4U43_UnF3190 [Asparagus officinalis]|uniref:KIB1-4 beta-propeller domain-containing protein n=1 Tax=Asparagus officinalis TaxID=4686 RepID=A0A1R3L763_ASPOF|nr:uncharacterized protein A4U43_UnF3190 [Asparagus officinalis]